MKARDIMSSNVQSLSPDCSIGEAVRRIAETKFQAFPVVDQNQILLGTVNIWRILQRVMPSYILSGELPDVRFAPDLSQLHENLSTLKIQPVSTVMNTTPLCVRPDDSVLECATVIMRAPKQVHLLPVIDHDRRLVGVISPWDLIKEISL